MTSKIKLTEGALQTIMEGGDFPNPIVQVLGSKKMFSNVKDSERYRLLLSDGKFKVNIAMYTVPANSRAVVNALEQFSVIKLKRFVSNVIKNRENRDTRILLILELDLIAKGAKVGRVIGDPVTLTDHELQCSQASDVSNGDSVNLRRKKKHVNHLSEAKVISPIASLNPFHNNWTIRARVTNKTTIRNWCNAKGEGKLFSVDLVDQGGEIRCTAFRELVDKFFERLEVDKVYYISKCGLQPINRQFCSLKHDFEMTFTPETEIQESLSDNNIIPQLSYNFTPLDKVAAMVAGTIVDVIAVVKSQSEVQTITAKSNQREIKKKELYLIDQSRTGITLTLWGTHAECFNIGDNPAIIIKNAKIYEFQKGKNLTMFMGSQLKINPDIPESHSLKSWFDSIGSQLEINDVSARPGLGATVPWMTFKEVQRRGLAQTDHGFYFQTFGTIILIRLDRAVYKSCPSPDCQKKVTDLENGRYRCEKCNCEYPNFKYRFLVSMNISDATSSQWVTVFSSEAEKIIGKTAQEIGEAMETNQDSVAKWFEEAQFKQFVFKCRAKMDTYNDEHKIRMVVVGINPICYEEHNTYLMQQIDNMCGIILPQD